MGRKKNRQHRRDPHIHRRAAPGTSPGTILPDPAANPSIVQAIAYGPDKFTQRQLSDLSEVSSFLKDYPILWLNVDGLGDTTVIEQLGRIFGLHPLALEDAVNTHQ